MRNLLQSHAVESHDNFLPNCNKSPSRCRYQSHQIRNDLRCSAVAAIYLLIRPAALPGYVLKDALLESCQHRSSIESLFSNRPLIQPGSTHRKRLLKNG